MSGSSRPGAGAEHLADRLAPVVAEAGLVLENVDVTPAGRRRVVRVVVDLPSGRGALDLDDVAEVSRAVSARLDESDDLLGATPYVLEVTTPGVDRPLTEPRHWDRATGRLVEAVLRDGSTVTGRVLAAGPASVTVVVPGAEPRELAFDAVARARVQVEFRRDEEVS